MRGNSNGNASEVECTEYEPPRRFKNKERLNVHMQFKYGRLPDSRDVLPNGKQSQMYQDLTDLVNDVLERQDEITSHLEKKADGKGNGNGDGLGNSNRIDHRDEPIGISSPSPADPTTYSHQGCGTPLEKLQQHCGGCGQEIEWDGLL